MKKRLTKEQKECVREWLKLSWQKKKERCPFQLSEPRPHALCASWFPRCALPDEERKGNICPCDNYFLSTVIKRARLMIK